MTNNVNIIMVDDMKLHREMLRKAFSEVSDNVYHFNVVEECVNGQELIDSPNLASCDLITLDIRMPDLDGLSTLLMLRKKLGNNTPVCMVSAENRDTVRDHDFKPSEKIQSMTFGEKLELIGNVEDRILNNSFDPKKINDMLTACEKLYIDPITYAKHRGANGYLQKPYQTSSMKDIIPNVMNGKFTIK